MRLDKKNIRKEMKRKRLDLDDETFSLYSHKIASILFKHKAYIKAKTVALYVSGRGEVDTYWIIEEAWHDKNVVVPKVKGKDLYFYKITSYDDLEKGYFNIMEPIEKEEVDIKNIDLFIVPLLCFDKNHYRIGYGGGFYDRILKDYQGTKIGIAFSFQEIENTYPEIWDIPLDEIITEEGIK